MKDQTTIPPEGSKPPEGDAKPPEGDKKPDVKAGDDKSLLNDKKDESKGAPEKYEAFKLPEGVSLDEKVATEAQELFKGMNLDQTQAQSLIDFHLAKTKEAAEAPYKLYTETRQAWRDEIKADPEIGNKLDSVKQTVSKALDSLGDAKLANEFRAAMDLTGAGDHPAFIKAFYKLAQKMTEGTQVTAGSPTKEGQTRPGSAPQSPARALYPNLP